MSATMQPAIGPTNGTRRGRTNTGARRARRTKAQMAAAVALNEPKLVDLRPAAIVRGDPATDFAATTIAQLVGKDPAVRRRAAQLIGAVCSELLKAA